MKTVIFSKWINDSILIDKNVSLCIGVFDGVHLGHQKILKECLKNSEYPIIMTFDKNPKMLMGKQKKVKSLNSKQQRNDLFEKMGFKLQVIIDFSPEISNLSAGEFISLLCKKMKIDKLVVGEDFKLGSISDQAGPDRIKEILNLYQHGSKVVVLKPVFDTDGEIISSSLLRKLIIKGKLNVVQRLLGYSYQLDLGLIPSQYFGGELLIKKEDLNQLVPEQGVFDGLWSDSDFKVTIVIDNSKIVVNPANPSFKKNRFLKIIQKRG